MIQGTSSGVGKSILTIGLCRILYQDGYSVAPFKSQNMSCNAYSLNDDGEMAKTQAIAAWACGIEPHADMNPVLLKPVREGTEVIVQGKSIAWMDRDRYREYKRYDAWIPVMESYARLSKDYEYIVLEGAGSPVEVNMKDDDIANMNMALKSGSPVILVADIDRGGVFADVVGTLALLSDEERVLVKGIIVNKCRGRFELFDEVRHTMEQITQLPVLGMVPYLEIEIEDEDNLYDIRTGPKAGSKTEQTNGADGSVIRQFDRLAGSLRQHLDLRKIEEIIETGTGGGI